LKLILECGFELYKKAVQSDSLKITFTITSNKKLKILKTIISKQAYLKNADINENYLC